MFLQHVDAPAQRLPKSHAIRCVCDEGKSHQTQPVDFNPLRLNVDYVTPQHQPLTLMKRLLLLAFSLTGISVYGLPIAYDGFDYPVSSPAPIYTNLVGQVTNNGANWVYAGFPNTTTNQPYIVSGSLSYPPLAPSVGNSVGFGNNSGSGTTNGMAARLNLPSAVSSGTLYYSFIMKLTDITAISTSGVFWAGFNNSAGAQTTLPSIVATRVVTRAAGSGQYQIGLDKSSSAPASFQWDPAIRNVDDVLFVVGSYTFSTASTTDDLSQLWVNPASGDFGASSPPAPLLTSTAVNDIGSAQIASFCIFNRNAAEPHGIVLDELRIGTSWKDVTPTADAIAIVTQPKDVRIIAGVDASFSVSTYLANTYQWQHNSVNIPNATNAALTIPSAQLSDAGTYRVIVGNGVATPLTSSNAVLTVKADTFPRLSPMWSIAPFARPYVTTDTSQNPMQRYFAYNVLSNQVLIVSRTNIDTLASTGMVYVLNATNGADLYQMNADSSIISGGLNGIALSSIDVAGDGAVYGANISDAGTGVMFRLYRWDNSGSGATPANVYAGDPFGLGTGRFGDSLAVHGTNVGTEVLLDDSKGVLGVVMRPTDSSMTAFFSGGGQFTNVIGGTTGGRTVLFADTNTFGPNTFWEHHRGGALNLASYDLPTVSSTILQAYTSFPSTMGVCGFNLSLGLLCGINIQGDPSVPDTLDLYDISNLSLPVYIASYNFPTNAQDNANRCGRVIFSGDKVFALDANNGFLAFSVVPKLTITSSGANVFLSWPTNQTGYTLTASPSVSPPVTFTNVSAGSIVGSEYVVTATPSSAQLFYRLKK
jgi:hypothetical protein